MITQQIISIVAEMSGKNSADVRLEDTLIADLGLDSLSLAELPIDLEDKFDIRIQDSDILDTTTVGDLVNIISRRVVDGRGN